MIKPAEENRKKQRTPKETKLPTRYTLVKGIIILLMDGAHCHKYRFPALSNSARTLQAKSRVEARA